MHTVIHRSCVCHVDLAVSVFELSNNLVGCGIMSYYTVSDVITMTCLRCSKRRPPVADVGCKYPPPAMLLLVASRLLELHCCSGEFQHLVAGRSHCQERSGEAVISGSHKGLSNASPAESLAAASGHRGRQ